MTYERDYILRMVRELSTFLARIVRPNDGGHEERSIADLDQAARTFVGLGLDVLEALPAEQATMMLSIGGSLDVNRAYATGRLLEERAEMASRAGNEELAASLRANALQMLADAALAFGAYLNDAHRDAVRTVADHVVAAPAPLPPRLLSALFETHLLHDEDERIVRLADALVARTDEPADRMTAIRIAFRGASPMLLGRLAPVLDAAVPGE